MPLDILIKNVALSGVDGLRDLGIADGRFVAIEQGAATLRAALILDAMAGWLSRASSSRIFISTRR